MYTSVNLKWVCHCCRLLRATMVLPAWWVLWVAVSGCGAVMAHTLPVSCTGAHNHDLFSFGILLNADKNRSAGHQTLRHKESWPRVPAVKNHLPCLHSDNSDLDNDEIWKQAVLWENWPGSCSSAEHCDRDDQALWWCFIWAVPTGEIISTLWTYTAETPHTHW